MGSLKGPVFLSSHVRISEQFGWSWGVLMPAQCVWDVRKGRQGILEICCTEEWRNVVRTKGRNGFIRIGAGWKFSVLRVDGDQYTQTANIFKKSSQCLVGVLNTLLKVATSYSLTHLLWNLQGIRNYFKSILTFKPFPLWPFVVLFLLRAV